MSGPSGPARGQLRGARPGSVLKPRPCLKQEDAPCVRSTFPPFTVPPSASTGWPRFWTPPRRPTAPRGYPPYNIERTDENAYRIEIAVAGFKPEELTIEVKENLLTVQGRKAANDETRRFLHRGLAERNFERRFQLADYVVVTDAQLADGLLSISLKRELPEAAEAAPHRDPDPARLDPGRAEGGVKLH